MVFCLSEGIPFVEARVKCLLSDVINNPVPCEMNKLLPFKINEAGQFLIGIQFNIFDCGGIGIGVCMSHVIGDALSFFTFVNMWAAISRGEKKLLAPEFVSASLFPPRNLSSGHNKPSLPKPKEKIITKRFVFTASKIEELRRKYTDNTSFENHSNHTRPTRIEALSAFIWTRFVTTTGLIARPDKSFTIGHMINLRTRIEPPQPEYSFGNLWSFTVTYPSIHYNLITQMRDSVKKMDKEFVKKIQDGYNHMNYSRERTASYAKGGEIVPFAFTSLCRFPIYEADFGWGKPVWAGSASRDIPNFVVFVDTLDGNGIEAWLALREDDMANFDSDKDLVSYGTPPKA